MQSEEFQVKALGYIMENPLLQLGEWPTPSHFENPIASKLCEIIRSAAKKIGHPITYEILKDRICSYQRKDQVLARKMAKAWKQMQRPVSQIEKKYLEKEIAEACRRMAVQEALLCSVDLWREERIDEINDVMQKALLVGSSSQGLGTFFFSQAANILSQEEAIFKPIRTLISPLDANLPHSGVCAKDLAVVLAMPGHGKTMFLLHIAKAALIQKKKVAYISLEMSEADLAERLIASFSGIPTDQIFEEKQKAEHRIKSAGRMLGDSLLIKQFPSQTASIHTIGAHLKLVYAQTGFKPALVIVDYAGEMAGVKKSTRQGSSERYYELGGVFSDLVSYAQEEDISLWTGAQATRAKGRELITIEDIAESFKGIFVASTVLSLNQNLQEYQNQQMRLFIAKNRKGISREIINICTNFSKGSFYRVMPIEEDCT